LGYGCFSVKKSQAETLVQYIASQTEHHQKISLRDELREMLPKCGVAFEERYLWDSWIFRDVPRFQRWVIFGGPFLGLASSA